MTAVSEDATAALKRRLAELEERLATALTERDAAIERQTANALVNFRLQSELRATAERQHASAEILRTISESSGDAEQSLTQIAETTARLFSAPSVTIRIAEGDEWIKTIRVGASSQRSGAQPGSQSAAPGANLPATVYQENRQIHIPDLDGLDPSMASWPLAATRDAGARTVSGTPLRRKDKAIGALIVYRDRLAPFTEEELALQQSFADQAVIAIENARLFDQTRQALDRQQAGAEILRTIAAAPNNAEQSLRQVVETTARLFGASSVRIRLVKDGEWGSTFHVGRSSEAVRSTVPDAKAPIGGRNLPGTVVAENRQIHIPDLDHIPPEMTDWPGLPPARAAGARTVSGTPLRREGKAIGALVIHRDHLQPFSEAELELQQSFADQAVIAIENARLFNETQEALERQTATADILKVIASSPSDVAPVFEAIASSAKRLINGFSTTVHPVIDDVVHLAAFTPTNPQSDAILKATFPVHRSQVPAVALVENGETAQIADSETADEQTKHLGRARGWRSVTFTPLMNRGTFLGFITCTRRETGVLPDHHIQLLRTFADQAVIAIENARLFNETQEALERQTATADILKVIASSPVDVQPVFDAIVSSAATLFQPCAATITTVRDNQFHWNATVALLPDFDVEHAKAIYPIPVDPSRSPSAQAILECRIIEIPDVAAPDTPELTRNAAVAGGFRSVTFVPLINQGNGFGTIILTHPQAGFRLSEKQLALVQTFADQAVIAIQNTRLFNETREALERQTATADILKVIASSPSDVQPVFAAIAARAKTLLNGFSSTVYRFIEGQAHLEAFTPTTPEADQILTSTFPLPVSRFAPFEIVQAGEVAQIPDTESLTGEILDIARARGFRSLLFAPLMNQGTTIGLIAVTRGSTGAFAGHHVELLKTFADQAVIAIENVRLFDEVQARTRELAKSLDDLRTAQDRLIQTEKLASLGQLTAGIAHEIKNPLNFVNNFAALSAELTDELKDALKPAVLDETIRAEVDELTGLLKDNLDKVVQHGKRADSIVKNMLLHSREGSGDHRPADVNALVEESLNLAYHGARAEKPHFNVTLKRDFDPDAGMIEAFPQEITRVLLNLISNGFYAVAKRKAEDGDAAFEPVVSATTKGKGDHVEIRIRDNGTGIPPEVKEKMFNPFFTTKPAGEGTGLGLSMSHDIIVKQHGGAIDVDTQPGAFTEFTIVLPRTSQFSDKTRGQT